MQKLVGVVGLVSLTVIACYVMQTPWTVEARPNGSAHFSHSTVTWGNGKYERWQHTHQRIIDRPSDWELTSLRYNLPEVELPVVFVFEEVDGESVAIQVNSIKNGAVLWSR